MLFRSGALTGLFCSKCQQVTGIDLSKRRSEINSYKNKAFSNLEIYVGNFLDINIETKYDYVTLIGVLEYSIYYVGGDDPFVSMLQKAREYLKPGGKLIIAIENKYGLKYWSGAREDHTGKFFDGISGYNSVERVNTFSKNKLEQLISKAGFTESEFFYPFPDYKMPSEVFSSKRLPSYGSLRNVTNVYDRDRYAFFNEEEVFDSLCKDELIELFVNSFLVFCQ